ncbi:TPA: hypothetical protein ACK3JW_000147 [Mannheimia haemolytica]
MTLYYKNGFYDDAKGGFVPEAAIEITEEYYIYLLEGQAQGKLIVEVEGKPILTTPPPTLHHHWNGTAWEISQEQLQAVISAEKSAKLAEINSKAQAFVNDLTEYDKTPPFERDTWGIQREEAIAWFADNNTPTPTLSWISQTRGVTLDFLRPKTYEKAIIYQKVSSIVAGQRQAYEDRLKAAESLEQIQAIKPVYQLPQGGIDDNH